MEADLLRQEQAIRLAHPDQILRRGFSLVSVGGRIVTRSSQILREQRSRCALLMVKWRL